MIIFYCGSVSAKAPVCQPHITKTQQKKKFILKVVFSLNLRLIFFFVGSVLHYKDMKSEEKVYSKVCFFHYLHIFREAFFFFFQQGEDRHSLLFLMHLFLSVSPFV